MIYVDPSGATLDDAGQQARIINVPAAPGLSGLLTRHLAGPRRLRIPVMVRCAAEKGGVAGPADILSTRAGYGTRTG